MWQDWLVCPLTWIHNSCLSARPSGCLHQYFSGSTFKKVKTRVGMAAFMKNRPRQKKAFFCHAPKLPMASHIGSPANNQTTKRERSQYVTAAAIRFLKILPMNTMFKKFAVECRIRIQMRVRARDSA